MSADPSDTSRPAPEAASRINDILASAERQVTEIVNAAERRSQERQQRRARQLDRRADELAEIAADLLSAAATIQAQAARLGTLTPLDSGSDAEPEPEPPAPNQHDSDRGAAPAAARSVHALRPAVPSATAAGGTPSAHGAAGTGSTPETAATPEAAATPGTAATPTAGQALAAEQPLGGVASPEASASKHVPTDAPVIDRHVVEVPADASATGGDASRAAEGAGSPASSDSPTTGIRGDEHADDGTDGPSPAASTTTDTATGETAATRPTDNVVDLDAMPIIAESDDALSADPPEKVDGARLVALSMAAEGRSREEVEAHVRDELGIVDHGPIIDYVFGMSTPASVVPSWPPRRRRRSL